MRKNSLILMFLLLSMTLAVAQSKLDGGLYLKTGIAHSYKFQMNEILTNMKTDKIPIIITLASLGVHVDYRNVVYSLDIGIGGMGNKQTWSTNLLANLSIGYQLFLPDENSLIFSGTLSYELYNVYSYLTKGSLDMEAAILITPTQFNVQLHQFMPGAKIAWRNKFTTIGIGYDVGCIPMSWTSDVVTISNNTKERINRIHFDIAYDIRKF
ncbi:MAG: hypothetical protein LBE13_17215 [Bacteroidales bacterium]|jgi:hypothetical protein|nr:hypothetical protein [Bacteroidales bacterium]